MENYKPNSHKSKEERANIDTRKKVGKAITGTAKLKKKNEVHKFMDLIIAEDWATVKVNVVEEVVVPTIKKLIYDMFTNGLNMFMYGESAPSKKNSTASRVSYRSYYDKNNDVDRNEHRTRNSYSYDDVIIYNRADAEEVLLRMDELMSKYGLVRVADFYDLVDITGSYTDNKYGWEDIRSARIVRAGDGWSIRLPKALPID